MEQIKLVTLPKKHFGKKIKVPEFILFSFQLFKLDPPASNILLMINREIDCERKCKVGKNQFMQHARHWRRADCLSTNGPVQFDTHSC